MCVLYVSFFNMHTVFDMIASTMTINSAGDSQSKQGIVNLTVAITMEKDSEDKDERYSL